MNDHNSDWKPVSGYRYREDVAGGLVVFIFSRQPAMAIRKLMTSHGFVIDRDRTGVEGDFVYGRKLTADAINISRRLKAQIDEVIFPKKRGI
ncbi:hypothetical protein WK92_15075 [Burkholderia ubonensis]|uniref:hypothetical protein n=1 Tax=Burkholderia ubonensis TaxID=101571 RepID=UPI0007577706|nr:hypothetical protein [Burkholderia ubonensis]KVV48304.1 hypothetical protein WK82_14205 [Burkholderia ubonensis]KVW21751.1 hypothetical protein WK92_15075 [Burkholderia ubonensis]KVW47317.1 hypothetical protein WK95_06350 [Burkholderia ubonensis]